MLTKAVNDSNISIGNDYELLRHLVDVLVDQADVLEKVKDDTAVLALNQSGTDILILLIKFRPPPKNLEMRLK